MRGRGLADGVRLSEGGIGDIAVFLPSGAGFKTRAPQPIGMAEADRAAGIGGLLSAGKGQENVVVDLFAINASLPIGLYRTWV